MVIKKQPVISWLLEDSYSEMNKIGVPATPIWNHYGYLMNGLSRLKEVQANKPNWGLPELIMPSFEEYMSKSAKSFVKIDHQLFQEFYKDNVCGILLSKDIGTIVYGFGENTLCIWVFKDINGCSGLYLYFYVKSYADNHRKIYTFPSLTSDPNLFYQDESKPSSILYELLTNKIMIYLAVKKYGKVETQVVAPSGVTKLDNAIFSYQTKTKVRNDSGQKVIVMDSKWFREIINDNDIFVRGFFRMQNKKHSNGEWYKELIFVDSFVRHGYHRTAKKENDIEDTPN